MTLAYDIVSPGHVLSVCEEAATQRMLVGGYKQGDLDCWGSDRLLYQGMIDLAGDIGGTVRHDLGTLGIYEFDTCRPDDLLPLLGRRRFGDFSFIGVMVVPRRDHAVYTVLYCSDDQPRAYVPKRGNAVSASSGSILDTSYGEVLYGYDRTLIEDDIRAAFGV